MSVLCLDTSSCFNECSLSTISLTSLCDLISSFNYLSSNFKCLFSKVFLPMMILNSRLALFKASKSNTSSSYTSCSLELPIGVETSPLNMVSFRDSINSLRYKIYSFITLEVDSSLFLFSRLLKMPKVYKENPSHVYSFSSRVSTSTLYDLGVLGMVSYSLGFSTCVIYSPSL